MNESEEFKLLVALSHPYPEQQIKQVTDAIIGHTIDWKIFLTLVCWHRVTPQVYRNLSIHQDHIRESVFQALRQAALFSQRISLQQSSRLVKITEVFNENKIQFIALKGVALSQFFYADSGRRQAKDIDILINSDDLMVAERLMTGTLGFIRTQPAADASEEEISYSNRCTKDRIYRHLQDNTEIEVHWQFTTEKPLLAVPFSELMSRSISLEFHNQTVAMLDYEHLWLYQSLHGTYSGWYRLHWVTDIAELLAKHQPDWENLLEIAEKYHCKKCVLEAVVLAAQIYQLPIPEIIRLNMQKTWQQQLSMPFALRALIKAQFINPVFVYWRALFWLPKKYYLLYFMIRMGQTPRGNAGWYRQHPIRFLLYYLLRPASFLIRRML